MKFEIKNRFTGNVHLTVEINCGDDTAESKKLGLAVIAAVSAGAYLSGAVLSGAYLSGADLRSANLRSADLRSANIIHCGTRSDGYEFYAHVKNGDLFIKAGCRYFNISNAREHWTKTRGGTPLGDESMALLDNAERLAKIRGML